MKLGCSLNLSIHVNFRILVFDIWVLVRNVTYNKLTYGNIEGEGVEGWFWCGIVSLLCLEKIEQRINQKKEGTWWFHSILLIKINTVGLHCQGKKTPYASAQSKLHMHAYIYIGSSEGPLFLHTSFSVSE